MGEDQALERLRDILARPEFQVGRSVPWWRQLFGPVFDLIDYLLNRFFQTVAETASGREGWLGLVVLGVCLALFLLVLVYLVRAVRLSLVHERQAASASLTERRERSERLWQTAQQLAAAGHLAEAVRMLYLSALYALDERALLHVETGLTNREHARQLTRLHPAVGQSFADLVERYDRVRYGSREVSSETFGELSGRVAHIRSVSFDRAAVAGVAQ